MELRSAQIEQTCPHCGKVLVEADSFDRASYTKDGVITLSFICPKCSAQIKSVYEFGHDVSVQITNMALVAIEDYMTASPEAREMLEQTIGLHTFQEIDEEEAAAEEKKPAGLTINYMQVNPNRLMSFDVTLNTAPPAGAPDAVERPYEPDDDQAAQLEYFHRQLEELDTVDDAINEIDSGYNLSDESEGE